MPHFLEPTMLSLEAFSALITLTALEIVLGIDNIVFIAIMTSRLTTPVHDAGPSANPLRPHSAGRRRLLVHRGPDRGDRYYLLAGFGH